MTGFNAGMAGLIQQCRLNSRVVVKKEAGELIKQLVKLSFPKDRNATRASIARTVATRFDEASRRDYLDSRITPGGVRWTRKTRKLLYGVANQLDWRNVTDVERVRKAYYTIRRGGRQVVPFLKPRKVQKVSFSRSIFLQAGMVGKVIKKIQRNVGRLKSGWLVSVAKGAIQISGSNMPPAWVTVHAAGARGRFEDRSNVPDNPAFVIANSATGITQKGMDFIVALAVKSRAAAMVTNAKFFLSGKKKLSDYAR